MGVKVVYVPRNNETELLYSKDIMVVPIESSSQIDVWRFYFGRSCRPRARRLRPHALHFIFRLTK